MTIATICVVLLLGLIAVLQFILLARSRRQGGDLAPVINEVGAVRQLVEQVNRSVREEIALNRPEQASQSQALRTGVGTTLHATSDSMSTKIDLLTHSVDTKLEVVRTGLEQRLAVFTMESGDKIEALTRSVTTSATNFQADVSGKLTEFRTALSDAARDTHLLQKEQTDRITSALTAARASASVLARALLRCGDRDGLARQVLADYRTDLRGHLAAHARAVLETQAAPAPR